MFKSAAIGALVHRRGHHESVGRLDSLNGRARLRRQTFERERLKAFRHKRLEQVRTDVDELDDSALRALQRADFRHDR